MEELQLKCIDINFDKEKPQFIGSRIQISSSGDLESLEYKFIVGKDGVWNTIQEFSHKNQCTWCPKECGNYMVMVQAREKYGKKSLDYLAKEDYKIVSDSLIEQHDNIEEKAIERINKDQFNSIFDNTETEEAIDNNIINISAGNKVYVDEFISSNYDESLLLEAAMVTTDEKIFLEGMSNMGVGKLFDEEVLNEQNNNGVDYKDLENDTNKLDSKKIIEDIVVDKKNMLVGERCFLRVKTTGTNLFLYRFYIRRYKDWDIIRDYTADSILRYTANEVGEKEFLIQCKSIDSKENFDDYATIKINVNTKEKVEIINFETLTKELIVGESLKFKVETNCKENREILYKFYKISNDGKVSCIQDYSTKNQISYIENNKGEYRILCLCRDILSNHEYDDRAVLVYNVKPYRDIEIKGFSADLSSPQVTDSEVKFKVKALGGKSLLYRFKVNGEIGEDSGFKRESEYNWIPKEPGSYEITVFVKDKSFDGEYEVKEKIDFFIEKRGDKPIKILDVIIDKEKKIITNEPINILINAEGGTHINYSFIVRKNGKIIEKKEYNKSNWLDFIPKEHGEYELEIKLKDKYSNKEFDAHTFVYFKSLEYIPGKIDYIIMPHKETRLVGDIIELECIVQNTQNVLIKYETKINGQSIEKTEFSKNRKLRFIPKIFGKYTIVVYSKNMKCKKEYDSKKEVTLYVSEASSVINTKIITNISSIKLNEELTFEVVSSGGKDVCYEFYLMEGNEWKKVQEYSKKKYYSFIPFKVGSYKILALAKSYYKKIGYEDYDQIVFEVKDIK